MVSRHSIDRVWKGPQDLRLRKVLPCALICDVAANQDKSRADGAIFEFSDDPEAVLGAPGGAEVGVCQVNKEKLVI